MAPDWHIQAQLERSPEMLGCKDKTYAFYLSNKGLILKRSQNRDQKDPGVQNTGTFKMNMNVKINTIRWFEKSVLYLDGLRKS